MPPDLESHLSRRRRQLKNPYAFLGPSGNFALEYSERAVEERAFDVLASLWRDRKKHGPSPDPISVISPASALERLGFDFALDDNLGFDPTGSGDRIAGLIEPDAKLVRVSSQFPNAVQRFTAAHELGHAALHDLSGVLHRDRPADGAGPGRPGIEREADWFAKFFLMPRNLLRSQFEKRFETTSFTLSRDTAFLLKRMSLGEFRRKHKTGRDLARLMASAEIYDGRAFPSLADLFGVSVLAMAIRLEELGLVPRGR